MKFSSSVRMSRINGELLVFVAKERLITMTASDSMNLTDDPRKADETVATLSSAGRRIATAQKPNSARIHGAHRGDFVLADRWIERAVI
jgi:hypothetical protein